MFKEYRYEVAAISAICVIVNLYLEHPLLAVVCAVSAVGNYMLAKEGK
ncbi:hypothetical protein VCM_00031 [Pseudomonas phage VCM]|uniref:Uncharacterized protein n=1 Tax=Pseudomonas phage VCM TaxID=1729937 RepID=A0A0S4KW77_9CAUD|nr:hypothetical protein VCM_00031 [Pseudomonas phage VCM]CUR44250.1 hypothetical protein VCM_00031 [Pseudomonas phage VCM]